MQYESRPAVYSSVSVYIDGVGICKVEGRNWLSDTIIEKDFESTVMPAEVLVNFSELVTEEGLEAVTITDLTLGYYYGNRGTSATTTAIPAYQITTDSGQLYLFDATTADEIKQ
jgi:hypothetical protein